MVPPPGRAQVLKELHGGHPGVSRMKSLARMFVWWPGLDADLEQAVRHCPDCQQNRPMPPPAPLQPWQWPTRPWARIHIDYAGPFMGHMFLVLIDAHSKWMEVYPMPSSTSGATIRQLRITFAQFGIPDTVVSDNGACFTSAEFEDFMRKNGVSHIKSAPYHPATNGLAERAVQVFKQAMKKMTEGTLTDKIARFLFSYCITLQTTTGVSPAELLMGRTLRSRLDLLCPDVSRRVEDKHFHQKRRHDGHASIRSFLEGEEVYVRNYCRGAENKCLLGRIVTCTGPVSYQVELQDGAICCRHQDQIRKLYNSETSSQKEDVTRMPQTMLTPCLLEQSSQRQESLPIPAPPPPATTPALPPRTTEAARDLVEEAATELSERRYRTRTRNPPDRYADSRNFV